MNQESRTSGQSLMELLIAVSIGAIIILAGVRAVSVYLRVSSQDVTYQGATFLAQELINNVTVAAEGNWSQVADAVASQPYYLTASGAGFSRNSGSETKVIGDLTYVRYFMVTPVCRDALDAIGSCGVNDPSTKKVTVTIDWQFRGAATTIGIDKYLTHNNNAVIWQTDWVGGATCPSSDNPTNAYQTSFCSASPEADFSSVPGSFKISGF